MRRGRWSPRTASGLLTRGGLALWLPPALEAASDLVPYLLPNR
jgi:hypothetical protein